MIKFIVHSAIINSSVIFLKVRETDDGFPVKSPHSGELQLACSGEMKSFCTSSSRLDLVFCGSDEIIAISSMYFIFSASGDGVRETGEQPAD